MSRDFKLVDRFSGYINKRDVTNVGSTFLIDGSKNTFINDGEKIQIRPGFSLFGAANTAKNPVESSTTFEAAKGLEIPLRGYDDELEFYYDGSWRRLEDGWTNVDFSFTHEAFWDDTENVGLQVFVAGNSNLYAWNGAVAKISSDGANTLTKSGSESWSELGFFTSANKTIIAPDGTEYTYTGGESTTTLTGVTPDPDGVFSGGEVVYQKIVTTSNQPSANTNNDIVSILKNQIYVADTDQHLVYISKAIDYTDFNQSTPRKLGDGETLTLEGKIKAFVPQEEDMYISAGKDLWYQTRFTFADDLLSQTLTIERLKTGPQQAAIGQQSTGNIKNDILFVTNEPTLDTLGRVIDTEKPQQVPISDSIKTYFESLDTTIPPSTIYFKNKSYISFPSSSVVLVYDWNKGFWNPPWTMGIRNFFIYGQELYGASSRVAETYKLLDGTSDAGNSIEAVATFSYRNYGERLRYKEFDEYATEGYIKNNTKLKLDLIYDYRGYSGGIVKEIDPQSDPGILVGEVGGGSIGKVSLGKDPLGSVSTTVSDLQKFRIIHEVNKQDFYEHTVSYSSNQIDGEWELLAHGGNTTYSKADNNDIKR